MPWMTAEETADRYRITVKGLLKQRSEDRAPGSLGKRVGKRVLWASEDLDAFDGREEPETFGFQEAIVIELRGINGLLHTILRFQEPRRAEMAWDERMAEFQEALARLLKEIEDD